MQTAVARYPHYGLGRTSLQTVIPSYLYQQYADDDSLAAFVSAYNQYAQAYVTWFNTIGLPIYTTKFGPLLDWVAQGIYGLTRPSLPSGSLQTSGPYNTTTYGSLPFAAWKSTGAEMLYATTDDVFKRVLTWHFYKGDGRNFNIPWLKRRIMRFLFGVSGTDYIIDQTYPVSVTFTGSQCNIVITSEDAALTAVFKAALLSGVLEVPFQFTYQITV